MSERQDAVARNFIQLAFFTIILYTDHENTGHLLTIYYLDEQLFFD